MKAVIFDLFETLITEWGQYKYTNREVAADLGIELYDFRSESARLQKSRYAGGILDTAEFYKIMLERLGLNVDESLIQMVAAKRESSKKKCFETIDPAVLTLIQALKQSGYKIGLISNCSAEEIIGLKDCALFGYLDAVVLSCDVGLIKPDAEIYEYCASLLQENAADCFFVGDGGSDELNGAKNAGMTPLRALWFVKHFVKNLDSFQAYPTFMDAGDLREFLCGK